jgi:hypothetical protein
MATQSAESVDGQQTSSQLKLLVSTGLFLELVGASRCSSVVTFSEEVTVHKIKNLFSGLLRNERNDFLIKVPPINESVCLAIEYDGAK